MLCVWCRKCIGSITTVYRPSLALSQAHAQSIRKMNCECATRRSKSNRATKTQCMGLHIQSYTSNNCNIVIRAQMICYLSIHLSPLHISDHCFQCIGLHTIGQQRLSRNIQPCSVSGTAHYFQYCMLKKQILHMHSTAQLTSYGRQEKKRGT